MHPGLTIRTAALLAAALVVTSALGYWGVSAYRKSQLHKAVSALVEDTSERLQAALAIDPGAAPTDQTVGRLDDHAQEVDKHVLELRGMSASPDRALVDAAEEYMLTVRQILRNQAASHRYRIQVSASDRALRDHMRAAKRRSASWIQEALRAKDRLEKDYFDYRLSAEALSRLLESYPDARKKLALQGHGALLADEAAAATARRRALDSARRLADEVQRARQLAAVR
jgi:hypothetical protein